MDENYSRLEESDAWGILKDLGNGVKGFRNLNLHHGDIQPSNIFVMDDKSLKLSDVCFINGEKSGFKRKYHDLEYTTPLGPQALNGMLLGPMASSYDKEKNDIWGIGNFQIFFSNKNFFQKFSDYYKVSLLWFLWLTKIITITTTGIHIKLIIN